MKRPVSILLLAASLAFGPGLASAAPIALFSFQSQPGDHVGQGQSLSLQYGSPGDTVRADIVARLPNGDPAGLTFILVHPSISDVAVLDFSTVALNLAMQPGFYPNAERAAVASAGHPGLDVGFDSRGANDLTGQFTVIEATFSADKTAILRFVADFEQHSSGAAPALFGHIEYSAAPEPAATALIAFSLAFLGIRLVAARVTAR